MNMDNSTKTDKKNSWKDSEGLDPDIDVLVYKIDHWHTFRDMLAPLMFISTVGAMVCWRVQAWQPEVETSAPLYTAIAITSTFVNMIFSWHVRKLTKKLRLMIAQKAAENQ